MIQSIRRLWPFIRPFKRDLILMMLLGVGVSFFSAGQAILLNALIAIYDQAKFPEFQAQLAGMLSHLPEFLQPSMTVGEEQKSFIISWLPYIFPIYFLILGIFRFSHFGMLNYLSERVVASIRFAMVRKSMRLSLTYHGSLERGAGGLISRVISDTQMLQQGLNFYIELMREPLTALLFLLILLQQDWRLTIMSLVFLPFFMLMTRKVSKSLRKYGSISRESMEDLTSVYKDSLDGVRVVQSFNLQGEMESRFQANLNKYITNIRKTVSREQMVSPLNEFVVSFLLMAFALYSIDQVINAGAAGSKFITFIVTAGLLQNSIKRLQDTGVKIQQSVMITERIMSVLDSPNEVPESVNPKPIPADWKTITFRDVSFSYGGEMVLKNVNLSVKRGEVLALVGESGSGKSTLVNLLERFYDPTSGEILIDDVPIKDVKLNELRHNIALVTQDVFLFRDSIARNIHAGDFSKDPAGIENAAKLANAHSFISATPNGYQSPVGERGSFLSGGEKQRLSIARAIFKDAPILILDEATSALDSVSEMEVQKGLNHLMEQRTAFVIAHRFSTIFNANRILVMKKGEIVEQGDHQSLLAKGGEYRNFFDLQMNHDERARQTSS